MDHDIDVSEEPGLAGLPELIDFATWARLGLQDQPPSSLAIRLVGEDTGQALNQQFRDRDRATNVLSFPAELPENVVASLPHRPLGDLVICAPVVEREAEEQGKPAAHHYAHLTVHGVLHLLGHDHQNELEAERMESRERALLARLDIPDPYRET